MFCITALIETNVLLLCQTAVYKGGYALHGFCLLSALCENYRADLNETYPRDVYVDKEELMEF